MFTTASKNSMLNALTVDSVSAHDDYPGVTGANEVSGGGYARVTVTFGSAAGGTRLLTAPANITVDAGMTIRWLGMWSSGVFVGCAPNAGVPREFFADPATDVVTCSAHGYADGAKVVFYADTPPGGLTEGTVYFVRDAATDTFKVAATAGGTAINLTSVSGAACLVSSITEEAYGSADTHTINSWTLGLPN